jgi:hypothetical protein
MKSVQWWMRVVGVLYLFMAGATLPFGSGVPRALPGIPFNQQYAQRMEDYQFLGGLAFAAIGASLLLASRDPRQNIIIVWTVVFLEILRGLLGDAYLLGRGAPTYSYGVLVLLHLAIMASGIEVARRARFET